MEVGYYKIAVEMLIETIEHEIEGYEMGMTETKDEIEKAIKNIKRRIEVVNKFENK